MTHSHHDHHHHHHHHHDHSPEQLAGRAFAIAVSLNLIFTIIEFICAWWSNSVSLMGDAGHNLTDVLALAFAWLANWLLTRKTSEKFSYGLKKTTILSAFVNAVLLILTSIFIAYESLDRMLNPSVIHEKTMIIVALIGIAVNGGTAMLFFKDRHDDLNVKGAYLHLLYDALISVGVVITGIIIAFTGWVILDPIIGMLIVLTIIFGTWALLRDSVNLLLDAVPTQVDQQAVSLYLQNIPGVVGVHDIHIWGLSTRHIALTAHLVMPEQQLSDADHVRVNAELKEKYQIDHVTIQVEQGTEAALCQHDPKCCL